MLAFFVVTVVFLSVVVCMVGVVVACVLVDTWVVVTVGEDNTCDTTPLRLTST